MKRILVIRFSALGDVAMLVPVLRATAEQHPEWHFTILSQQRMADLFAEMPENVTFAGVDLKRQSLRDFVRTLGRFDAVADMHGVWRSLYVRWYFRLRGAKTAVIHKSRWNKWLLTHGLIRRQLTDTSERYEKVLQRLIDEGQSKDRVKTKQRQTTDKRGICIAPFAAHRGKTYPLERMERVVELLSGQGEKIILFGSKEESAVMEQWAKRYPNVESVAGTKSLREELEIIRRSRVMLTMDSANMHLASLVGTRVVSIWGATHPFAGFLGYGQSEKDCIQRDLKCRPCSVYGKKKCRFGDYRCLDITPEEIVERLK